jgi:hypothetical protein
VTARHLVLVAAGLGVLGLGVYLYVAVNSTATATANVRPSAPEAKASPEENEESSPTKRSEDTPSRSNAKVLGAVKDSAVTTKSAAAIVEGPGPGAHIDIKKDELMSTANKAYDHGDFDEAIVIAKKVLANDPANTRMLRIVVSASCILDDAATAQKNYLLLPIGGNDRADMKKRCDRYGVTFTES